MPATIQVLAETTLTRTLRLAVVVGLAGLSGACSQIGADLGPGFLASAPVSGQAPSPADAAPQSELQKATEYWGKAYSKAPQDANTALSYAKNLKALGRKSEAFSVLQLASQFHAENKDVASEYGRLALELDQTTLAAKLLEFADDPLKPDWRLISARGAALAKLGRTKDAILHLERAQKLAPAQASVLNNLALAYTMDGQPQKAEQLLRQAVAGDSSTAKTRQNLALVLGLQGKYDEATRIGSTALAADAAKQNTELLRKIVKLEPKAAPPATEVAAASPPAPVPAALAEQIVFQTITTEAPSETAEWSSTIVGDAR